MKILFLMSGASEITLTDGTRHKAGFWAEEFVVPCLLFQERGYDVEVATAGGIPPVVDPRSVNPEFLQSIRPPGCRADDAVRATSWREMIRRTEPLVHPRPLEDLGRSELLGFASLYLCCGLACLADGPEAPLLSSVLGNARQAGIPLAAIGYGLATTLSLRDREGRYPFAGYRLTALSRYEEQRIPLCNRLPVSLQDELEGLGVEFLQGHLPWDSHVVWDRDLVTGQNPGSANLLAETLLAVLAPARARRFL